MLVPCAADASAAVAAVDLVETSVPWAGLTWAGLVVCRVEEERLQNVLHLAWAVQLSEGWEVEEWEDLKLHLRRMGMRVSASIGTSETMLA